MITGCRLQSSSFEERRVPPATSSARASMKADAQARTALMCVVNSKSECCTISSSSQAPSTSSTARKTMPKK